MNTESPLHPRLHALLDGTLDAATEQEVFESLARDREAQEEFARMAQLHLWLSGDEQIQKELRADGTAGNVIRRHGMRHRGWWLAAAVAAAILILTMGKLWPLPGEQPEGAYAATIQPVWMRACANCHGNHDLFLSGAAQFEPGSAGAAALWNRLSGGSQCAGSLQEGERALIRAWIASGSAGMAAS